MKTTKRTEIYYKKSQRLEIENERIEDWETEEENKEAIKAFQISLFAKGSKQYRVSKITADLRRACDLMIATLPTMTKEAMENYLATINRTEKWSEHTKVDYIRNVKQFYNWYQDEDPRLNNGHNEAREQARRFYRYLKKIKITKPRKKLLYGEIITDNDLNILLKQGCSNSLERAMVSLLQETGVRVGELLGIRLQDIERKERHAVVRVDGKTGERRVPVLNCIPYLEMWLRDHPDSENPQALLWVSTHNGHQGNPLKYLGARKLIKRVVRRSKLNKKDNLHWFRHSRATLNAPLYETSVLCQLMGWELDSKQVRTYVHLSGKECEKAFKERNGLQTKQEKIIKPKVLNCGCGKINDSDSRYCFSCGKPLSVKVVIEDENSKNEATEEAMKDFAKLAQNPEALMRIMELAKKFEGGLN